MTSNNNNNILIINFKNYIEIGSKKTLELAKIAEKIKKEYQINIMVSPPIPSLSEIATHVDIPVISQHVDYVPAGASTGYISPEILKSYGISGSLLNHSEHRIEKQQIIKQSIEKLREIGLMSIVCANTAEEVGILSKLNPDIIAIEPPELIGSGRAVSKENPKIVLEAIEESQKYSNAKIICGAGITDGHDVKTAIELGTNGILLASGVVKSTSWEEKLRELAGSL